MRSMTSCPRESNIEPQLASALMLVPFALAFQHIQNWVLVAKGLQNNDVTPRDAILLLRGIGATVVALNSCRADSGSSKSKTPWDTMCSAQVTNPKDFITNPERSHIMFPVLDTTYQQALSQLYCRIESALATHADENTTSVSDAYNILNDIMSSTFSDSKEIQMSSDYVSYVGFPVSRILLQGCG